jgi:hypothetical protein
MLAGGGGEVNHKKTTFEKAWASSNTCVHEVSGLKRVLHYVVQLVVACLKQVEYTYVKIEGYLFSSCFRVQSYFLESFLFFEETTYDLSHVRSRS